MPSHTASERRRRTRGRSSSSPARRKIDTVLGEFKRGTLKSSSGQTVTKRSQALAIALSEARRIMRKSKRKSGKSKKP